MSFFPIVSLTKVWNIHRILDTLDNYIFKNWIFVSLIYILMLNLTCTKFSQVISLWQLKYTFVKSKELGIFLYSWTICPEIVKL